MSARWPFALFALLAGCNESAPPPPEDRTVVPEDAVVLTDVPVLLDTTPAPADATAQCPAPLTTAAPRTSPAPTAGPLDSVLRLNHLQAKGTHNSYHLRPMRVIPEWDYAMSPLDVQLESEGVRALELDLRWDPVCGRFRVFHLPVIDDRSTCNYFTDCLGLIRRWSDAHPGHHALFIQLEPKDSWDEPTTMQRLDAMDAEIRAVFPPSLVITPDEVRGTSATLPEAIAARGWPTLGATRGRVLFFIDRTDALRTVYTHGGRDLNGRMAFVDSRFGDPFAATMVLNSPTHPDLARALREGYLVRVFSWAASDMALTPEAAQAALDSGAQILSTDYPVMARGGMEGVRIPGGNPSRCNPVTAPMGCTARAVEDL